MKPITGDGLAAFFKADIAPGNDQVLIILEIEFIAGQMFTGTGHHHVALQEAASGPGEKARLISCQGHIAFAEYHVAGKNLHGPAIFLEVFKQVGAYQPQALVRLPQQHTHGQRGQPCS